MGLAVVSIIIDAGHIMDRKGYRSLFSGVYQKAAVRILVVQWKAIMISGRTLAQGAGAEAKMAPQFGREASSCSLFEEDYGSLELSAEGNVLVSNEYGKAVMMALRDSDLSRGLMFIPVGPWANATVWHDTDGCGMPKYKGVLVAIAAGGIMDTTASVCHGPSIPEIKEKGLAYATSRPGCLIYIRGEG